MQKHPADSVSPTDRAISGAGVAEKRGSASGAAEGPAVVQKMVEDARKEALDEDEIGKPPIARRPYTPTAAEVEAHLPLHLEVLLVMV